MSVIYFIVGIVVAYLIGSVSTAVFFGRLFHDVDVREHGSGNAGATNTMRVLGTKAGLTVLFIDAFKGWLVVSLSPLFTNAQWDNQEMITLRLMMAVAVVLGHVFPLYTNFKGGKGVATLMGVAVALYPIYLILILLGVFIVVFALTRYVSLGSITVALFLPVLAIWVFHVILPLQILAVIIAILVPITHKKNIKRLLAGEESRLSVKK